MLLRGEIGSLPLFDDTRGRGLSWAVEFMLNNKPKMRFEPEIDFCGQVVKHGLDTDLNVLGNLRRTGKFQVGHVLVCPPYNVTEGN